MTAHFRGRSTCHFHTQFPPPTGRFFRGFLDCDRRDTGAIRASRPRVLHAPRRFSSVLPSAAFSAETPSFRAFRPECTSVTPGTKQLPGCPSGADNLPNWDPAAMARSQELAHLFQQPGSAAHWYYEVCRAIVTNPYMSMRSPRGFIFTPTRYEPSSAQSSPMSRDALPLLQDMLAAGIPGQVLHKRIRRPTRRPTVNDSTGPIEAGPKPCGGRAWRPALWWEVTAAASATERAPLICSAVPVHPVAGKNGHGASSLRRSGWVSSTPSASAACWTMSACPG